MDFIFTLSICQFVFILLFVFIYILKLDVYKKLTLFLCTSLFIAFLSSAFLLSYNYYGYKETFIYILVGVATCSFLASLFILLPFIINFITKKDDVIYNSNEYGASRTPMYYQRPIKNGYVESLYPTKKLPIAPTVKPSFVFIYFITILKKSQYKKQLCHIYTLKVV